MAERPQYNQTLYNDKRKRKREVEKKPSYTFEVCVNVGDNQRLESVKDRLRKAKEFLGITPKSSKTQNADLIEALLDAFERDHELRLGEDEDLTPNSTPSQLGNQIHTPHTENDDMFICTYSSLTNLVNSLVQNGNCSVCGKSFLLTGHAFERYGHAISLAIKCIEGHSRKWFSSPVINGKYYVNCR